MKSRFFPGALIAHMDDPSYVVFTVLGDVITDGGITKCTAFAHKDFLVIHECQFCEDTHESVHIIINESYCDNHVIENR